jgi:hypothetical protein
LYLEQGYEAVKKRLDAMLYKDQDEEENRYQSMITADIMEIIDLFMHFNLGKEEAHNITRLLDWKPIVPLTGAEDEWGVMETWGDDRHTQQNKECSAVFRNNYDNRTAYYFMEGFILITVDIHGLLVIIRMEWYRAVYQ